MQFSEKIIDKGSECIKETWINVKPSFVTIGVGFASYTGASHGIYLKGVRK